METRVISWFTTRPSSGQSNRYRLLLCRENRIFMTSEWKRYSQHELNLVGKRGCSTAGGRSSKTSMSNFWRMNFKIFSLRVFGRSPSIRTWSVFWPDTVNVPWRFGAIRCRLSKFIKCQNFVTDRETEPEILLLRQTIGPSLCFGRIAVLRNLTEELFLSPKFGKISEDTCHDKVSTAFKATSTVGRGQISTIPEQDHVSPCFRFNVPAGNFAGIPCRTFKKFRTCVSFSGTRGIPQAAWKYMCKPLQVVQVSRRFLSGTYDVFLFGSTVLTHALNCRRQTKIR